jgi:hypothetical protein
MTLRWVASPLPGDVRHLRALAGAAGEPRLAGHPMSTALRQPQRGLADLGVPWRRWRTMRSLAGRGAQSGGRGTRWNSR